MAKKKGLITLPAEEELMEIFLTARGTSCRGCALYGNTCTYHLQNPQAFICPIDAHNLAIKVMELLGHKPALG